MLNPSYTIQKFSEEIQQITTLKQFIHLTKSQDFNIEIDLIHRIPSVLTWNPVKNSFSGDYHLLIFPKMEIEGTHFAPQRAIAVKVQKNIKDCENIFLGSLKDAIKTAERVF